MKITANTFAWPFPSGVNVLALPSSGIFPAIVSEQGPSHFGYPDAVGSRNAAKKSVKLSTLRSLNPNRSIKRVNCAGASGRLTTVTKILNNASLKSQK